MRAIYPGRAVSLLYAPLGASQGNSICSRVALHEWPTPPGCLSLWELSEGTPFRTAGMTS
jgi:hypothetical protein